MVAERRDFEEFGLKVQRAQLALDQVRGIGRASGIEVVVDVENHLLSVTVTDEDAIVQAYNAAVADVRPKIDEAMRELRADPQVDALSRFIAANPAQREVERVSRDHGVDDDGYYEERYRRGWRDR